MEQRIKDRYSLTVLQEAMRRYDVADGQIRPLDGFESFIYEFQRGPQDYILRLAHSLRRSADLIRGEVDWINTLAGGGVPVARAVHSRAGNLVESIADGQGGYFLATAFVKAAGKRPWEAGWTPERYATYGRLLGRMHALAQGYQPAQAAWKRPEWDDNVMELPEHFLPASETVAKQKYRTLCDHLHTLPKDSASYGLIHQDAHQSNFLMDEAGSMTLFDFDDCGYSWFINDIAIVLFYMSVEEDDAPAFTQAFLPAFLRGYRQFHSLRPQWLQEIPAFLKIREIELYAVIHRDFDLDDIHNDWCRHFMRERKYKIENDVPFIDFDFEALSTHLL